MPLPCVCGPGPGGGRARRGAGPRSVMSAADARVHAPTRVVYRIFAFFLGWSDWLLAFLGWQARKRSKTKKLPDTSRPRAHFAAGLGTIGERGRCALASGGEPSGQDAATSLLDSKSFAAAKPPPSAKPLSVPRLNIGAMAREHDHGMRTPAAARREIGLGGLQSKKTMNQRALAKAGVDILTQALQGASTIRMCRAMSVYICVRATEM